MKEPNLAAEAGQGLLSAATSYARGDMGGVMSGVSSLFKTATGSQAKAEAYARQTRTSPADVVRAPCMVLLTTRGLMRAVRYRGVGARTRRRGMWSC